MKRGTNCLAVEHRLMRPRDTPRIATSGQLTIGVNDVPPMPPRFVIVKPPPCISSSDSLPVRAFSESLGQLDGQIEDALLIDVADHRHQQPAIGVHGDADVDGLLVDDLVPRRRRSRS